jgi:flagellar P-ring protein precursor FlgI
MKTRMSKAIWLCILAGMILSAGARPAHALRVRDAVRMKNEVPNELVGMGIVVGLQGTGDGGDFLPTMRPLMEMMRRFDDPVLLERELKNANNVAIVTLSMSVPTQGAHAGEKLDVKVSALAAKSLKGGHLFVVPLYAPRADVKMVLASATGGLVLPDDKHPTEAIIPGGGALIEDILPEEIRDNTFTLVLHPKMASRELASAIADQINEDVAPQTGGKSIALAIDSTSVQVTIPQVERANPTPFIARLLTLPLPTLPDPAKVVIDRKTKTIVFSDEVEVAPTLVSQGNLTITIGQPASPTGTKVPFVAIDPKGTGNAKLRDLQNALNLLKVSADDRIAIVEQLDKLGALKAKLEIDKP